VLPGVRIVDAAVCFRGPARIDIDGAPNAYCLRYPSLGLDALGNAKGADGGWASVITVDGSRFGEPLEQGPNDPAPGYLISTTALNDHSKPRTDPTKYVDAATIPYVSIPPELELDYGLQLGDLGVVIYQEALAEVICADVGPRRKLGEISMAAANELGIPDSPRHGGIDEHAVIYVLFPNSLSIPPWPRACAEFQYQAGLLFANWGGMEKAKGLGL